MKNPKIKKRWRRIFTWAAWVLLAQFVLVNVSAALYAHKLTHLYKADKDTWTRPVSNNIFAKTWRLFTGPKFYRQEMADTPAFDHNNIRLKTQNGIAIEAWYAGADSTARGTVLLFHGLMGHKAQLIHEAVEFRNLGYNIMLVDLRAHGNSGGNITTMGYREAEEVKLAYNYISQKGEKNIFLWGASMGAVAMIKAISDYGLAPRGIIIEMPFLSLQSHLKARARLLGFPEQPFGFFTSFWIGVEKGFNGWRFQTTRYAKKVQCPVLMQYGKKDKLVLPAETEAIFEAIASKNKKLELYDHAGHTQLLQNDPVTWRKEVEVFVQSCHTSY